MKARVKATGETVEVTYDYDLRKSTVVEFYTNIENPKDVFIKEDLEFIGDDAPDYWEKLLHQYAGMAMQGILAHGENYGNSREDVCNKIANYAIDVATALVKKLKKSGI